MLSVSQNLQKCLTLVGIKHITFCSQKKSTLLKWENNIKYQKAVLFTTYCTGLSRMIMKIELHGLLCYIAKVIIGFSVKKRRRL